jgi:DNA invertase Pin-like site-specific DNA recombinase
MNISYLRVSTEKQDLRRQEQAFQGIKIDKKYTDKVSGKGSDRPGLNKLRLEAKPGDIIYIESISRLGRSVSDLQTLIKEFKDKGCSVKFIKENILINGEEGNSMTDFLFNILSSVSEMERQIIVERVQEGVKKAKQYGTKSGRPFGRPERENLPTKFFKYYPRWKHGKDDDKLTGVEFARLLQVSRTTLYRWIRLHESDKKATQT